MYFWHLKKQKPLKQSSSGFLLWQLAGLAETGLLNGFQITIQ